MQRHETSGAMLLLSIGFLLFIALCTFALVGHMQSHDGRILAAILVPVSFVALFRR
jgi:hypothetical protein